MKGKRLIKSVLTDSALIELFCVGLKCTNNSITYIYQIVTYFRFSNKVKRSKYLFSHDAINMFNEMCSVSI